MKSVASVEDLAEKLAAEGEHALPFSMGSVGSSGMTLRDYFAAKAMQAVMSTVKHEDEDAELYSMSIDWYAQHATHAYTIADAMLAARGSA